MLVYEALLSIFKGFDVGVGASIYSVCGLKLLVYEALSY